MRVGQRANRNESQGSWGRKMWVNELVGMSYKGHGGRKVREDE
jgi:hypothetical protein